jgi:hypothetical protein
MEVVFMARLPPRARSRPVDPVAHLGPVDHPDLHHLAAGQAQCILAVEPKAFGTVRDATGT